MRLFSIEYSRAAYLADFIAYGVLAAGLTLYLVGAAPRTEWWVLAGVVVLGLALWTLIEYAVHRFLMHGVDPVRRWHGEHHRRPKALLGSPTLVSIPLFLALVFLPVWALSDTAHAAALTLGIGGGYLLYSTIHHAIHHSSREWAWLKRRQDWHALHHRSGRPVCFGVSTSFWDYVFGTTAGVVTQVPRLAD
jgi:cyclopropane-fatty-acyl-phospholipid synthase